MPRASTASTVKTAITFVAFLVATPAILVARLLSAVDGGTAFISFGCLFGLVPGRLGSCLRVGYYMGTLAAMSPQAQIGFGSFFSKRSASVGAGVRIGAYCVIGAAKLADDVIIASRVSITSGRHQHGSASSGPHQGESSFESVSVGARTWIGEGAVVMATVGADCIVGAGTVVASPVPDRSVVRGQSPVLTSRA